MVKFFGWSFRIFLAVLGVSLFLLQSYSVKKYLLELIVNRPFCGSLFRVEVGNVCGLFPFQFTVSSLELKEGEEDIMTLSDVTAVWSVPSLLNRRIKVDLAKGAELAGHLSYVIGQHALFADLKGTGLPICEKGSVTSLFIDLTALDLMKGRVSAILCDGQASATLSFDLEEISDDRFNVSNMHFSGKEVDGKGEGIVYPLTGTWEGQGDVSLADLSFCDRWFQKGLGGSVALKFRKKPQKQAVVDVQWHQARFAGFQGKRVAIHANLQPDDIQLSIQGEDVLLNRIALTKLIATGNYRQGKGTFEATGSGVAKVSLKAQGHFVRTSKEIPQTEIVIEKAELHHPMHQLSLKQPATVIWREKSFRASKLFLATGGGQVSIENLWLNDHLAGDIHVERLPLTLLRIIDPNWIASGSLSGKGKLGGAVAKPDVTLSLEGKSLQWRVPEQSKRRVPEQSKKRPSNRFLKRFSGLDFSGTLALSQGALVTWKLKLADGRWMALACEGKLSLEEGRSLEENPIDVVLKGQMDMSLISLIIHYGDLIQGKATLDLTAKGMVGSPQITGNLALKNGLYENALYGTLIKNITLQGTAVGNVLTLSRITGQDASKGRVRGQGVVKFAHLLNPEVDLQLNFDRLIVVQNDEISGKAKGGLRLHGPLTMLRISGDVVVQPIEIRLDEHIEKMATITLLEKKKDGFYQTLEEHRQQEHLQKGSSLVPLDIKLSAPGQIYLRGYGLNAQWRGSLMAVGPITNPHLVGELTLVRGAFDLLGKPLKLTEGRIIYSNEVENDPLLSIIGTREVGEITAAMRIEGRASNPKITFSSSPALPQEEILARLLFGKGMEGVSVTQSLQLANALSAFKGQNGLNFTDKIRSAFGLDVLEFKERKGPEDDEFKPPSQQVSVGKQISEKIYLSLDQSVSGDGGTTAIIQYDITPTFRIEADVGGEKNSGIGFAWIKKY
jgi:translocation and assembly module TamB